MSYKVHGAALEFIQGRFGGLIDVRQTNPTVGTSVSNILGRNPDRVGVAIVNLGTAPVYLAFDANVASTRGIQLDAVGGAFTADVVNDAIIPTLDFFAVSTGAGNSLYVIEVYRVTVTQ